MDPSPSRTRRRGEQRWRRALQGALAVGVSSSMFLAHAPTVSAQDLAVPDLAETLKALQGEPLPTVPGQPALPNMPGLGEAGGAEQLASGLRAAADPFVPEGGFRQQQTQAPLDGVEGSTNPPCAQNVFVGVPGTFEINRDDDPSVPVGLLGNFVKPLQAGLGSALSATFINYDADSGVNGTSYKRSTDSGTKKTLATIIDVAQRCKGSQIFLAGFSQGAEIAGDAAMQIGQNQTPVDPGRIGGVVLFADPRRDENANLIVGTRQQQPLLPEILTGAIDQVLKDPSLAQLRGAAKPLNDLSRSLGGGDLFPGMSGPSNTDTQPTRATAGGDGRVHDSGAAQTAPGGLPGAGGIADAPAGGGAVQDSGNAGGIKAPAGGGAVRDSAPAGGLPAADTSNGGAGGLPVAGASATTDGTITNGLYVRPDGESAFRAYTAESRPEITVKTVQNETEETSDDSSAAESYLTGACGSMTWDQCKNTPPEEDADTSDGNPYEADLRAAVESADGASLEEKVAEVCGVRLSAEVCGGSQIPADAATSKDDRPDDAKGLVILPLDITEGCDESPSPNRCQGGVTRIPDAPADTFPTGDGVNAYWETPALSNRTSELQGYWHALQSQSVTRADLAGGAEKVRVADGVSTVVNPQDGQSRDLALTNEAGQNFLATGAEGEQVTTADLPGLLEEGWVLGRSTADEHALPAVIDTLYRFGGCGELTLNECYTTYQAGSGDPESTIPTGQVAARAVHQSQSSPEGDIPVHYTETCLAKTLEDCLSQRAAADVASLPTVNADPVVPEAAGPANTTTATSVQASTSTTDPAQSDEVDTTAQESDIASAESATSTPGSAGTAGDAPDSEASEQQAAGELVTSSAAAAAGEEAPTTTRGQAGQDAVTPTPSPTATGEAEPETNGDDQPATGGTKLAQVEKLTLGAVAGGGLSGPRDADFGDLTGRVVSPCVPGDVVCSLPENSELARSLVTLGKNVSLNIEEIANAEGPTRMGGMLAVQAVDMILDITGMPRLKLSPETITALINLVAGATMIHMGNQAGAMLIASTIEQLPTAIPEVIAQLQDLPAIIEQLPKAGENAAKNLGLVNNRVGDAFATAGLGNPTAIENLPAMLPGLVQSLITDNTGLLEIATNPMYYTSGEKHAAFDSLKVAGDADAMDWSSRWLTVLGKELAKA